VRRSKKEAEVFTDARESLEAWLPLYSSRPIQTAIRCRFIETYAGYYALVTDVGAKASATRTKRHVRFDKQWTLLATFLFSSAKPRAGRDWRNPPIVNFLLRHLGRPREGRPTTKRCIAVQAMEMKLEDPKRWTWPKITSVLCDCDKNNHDIACQDNLRREILHVRKLLRDCGCKLG
jgi:hypothetical protein